MSSEQWVALVVGVLGAAGLIWGAWLTRRSSKDSNQVESRRVEVEVQNANLDVLRTTAGEFRHLQELQQQRADRMEARADKIEAKVEGLRQEIRGYQHDLRIREGHIDVLEQWIWSQKPPPPPPRPRMVEPDGVATAASPAE